MDEARVLCNLCNGSFGCIDRILQEVEPIAYNYSNLTSSNETVALLDFANEVTNGWYGIVVIVGFFLVLLISFMHGEVGAKRPFAAASFLTLLVAFLFRAMDLIKDDVLFICLFATVGSIIALAWKKEPY